MNSASLKDHDEGEWEAKDNIMMRDDDDNRLPMHGHGAVGPPLALEQCKDDPDQRHDPHRV